MSRSERRWVEAAIVYVSVAATAVAFVLALCVWLVDREAFSSFGEAIWWAIVTVSTVGYGDVIPENGAGRAVAALLIVFSMAFFPVFTGLITAALINLRDRSKEDDVERQASAHQEELVEQLRSIDDRLRRIEDSR